MSEFLTWLWGVVIAGLSWLVWLLWQGITWAAWLLWQGVTWLAALVVAHWLVALWIVLAVAAVVLFLWARSRISDAEGYMRGALRDRDRALSRGSEAADEARRVKEELALSDNELRRQRHALGHHQCANPLRPAELVCRQAHEIDPELGHVDGDLACGLHRVGVNERAVGVRHLGDARHRLNNAGFVVGQHDRNEFGAGIGR